MVQSSDLPKDAIQPIGSFKLLISRVAWCFAGPVSLVFLAYKIACSKDGWTTAYDIAFPLVAVATIAARWFSFRNGDPTNAEGNIATVDQVRQYSLVFLCGAIFIWVVSNALGNFVLN